MAKIRRKINRGYDRVAYLCEVPNDADVYYDSQNIADTIAHTGIPCGMRKCDITGMAVLLGDGDYIAVWYTTDNAPYLNNAQYEQCPLI